MRAMTVKPRVLVVKAEEGRVTEVREHEGTDVARIAKEVASRALSLWDPGSSDFTVIRSSFEARYKLPIKPELYDVLEQLDLPKSVGGGELYVQLPVYTISFDNAWQGDKYVDKRVYVVALVIDDESRAQIVEYAKDATSGPKQLGGGQEIQLDSDALKRLEEGLREAEEAERGRRRRSRKRSTS